MYSSVTGPGIAYIDGNGFFGGDTNGVGGDNSNIGVAAVLEVAAVDWSQSFFSLSTTADFYMSLSA